MHSNVSIRPVPALPRNFAVSNPNEAAVITLPAGRGRWVLNGILWSYSASPTAGRLTVGGGGWNIDIDITDSGPGFIPMYTPEAASDDGPVVITLYASGVGIVGKLNLMGVRVE